MMMTVPVQPITHPGPVPQAGFTLLEVLLAIALTAVLAMLAYGSLSAAISAAEGIRAQSEQLAAIEQTLAIIETDIRHAINRPIIDAYGDEQPALLGDAVEPFWLQLTRRGLENFRGDRRTVIRRVAYELEGDQLWRIEWLALDRWSEDEYRNRALLFEGIDDLAVEFLEPFAAPPGSAAGVPPLNWLPSWGYAGSSAALPEAIRVSLEFRNLGRVQRIIEVQPDA